MGVKQRKDFVDWFCSLLVQQFKTEAVWWLYFVSMEEKNRQENLEFWFGNQNRPFCDLMHGEYG